MAGSFLSTPFSEADLYDSLGLRPDATDKAIRDAYRRLAMLWHPDRNPGASAEAKFKEIRNAYAILKDRSKRADYDRAREGAGFSTYGRARAAGRGAWDASMAGAERPRGDDVTRTVTITLEEQLLGTRRDIAVSQTVPCARCRGGGRVQDELSGVARRCPDCRGTGAARARKGELEVRVPPGMRPGGKIRLDGLGALAERGEAGDLKIEVRYAEHRMFDVRQFPHLESEVPISVIRAIVGGPVLVPLLDEPRMMEIELAPGEALAEDALRVLRGRGLKNGRERGDLFIRWSLAECARLSEEQVRLLEEVLRLEELQGSEGADVKTWDVELERHRRKLDSGNGK